MTVVDLSYAAKKTEPGIVLGICIKGWHVGWSTGRAGQPVKCGLLRPQERHEGKTIPVAHRAASVFRTLLALSKEEGVELVLQEFVKSASGPIWNIPPLLTVALGSQYTEIRDWMEAIKVDKKSLNSWASLALGKPPEHDVVSQAMGLAAVGSQEFARQIKA